jgi:hypothetical protein
MVKTRIFVWCMLIGLALGHGLAHAARVATYVQTPSPATAIFNMGTMQSLSYLITNANTGTNTSESIFRVQFVLNAGGSTFNAATAAPAGWTRSSFGATSVTFTANSLANAIATGSSASFTLVLTMNSTSADVTQSLNSINSSYTKTGNLRLTKTIATTGSSSWTLKSLAITSFQITDTLGNPISSLAAGGSFKLVMTVKNNSTVTQNGIISNPNPPGATKTGSVTQGLTSTVSSPSPFNLTAGSSGTITFTFSTAGGDNGTIYFTASARNGATVTSASAVSPTLTVAPCVFSASFTAPASASCAYAGSNITLTMQLTNGCSFPLSSVTPSVSTTGPATLVSGPTPATIASIPASGGTASVGWVYQLNTSAATNPFTFNSLATHSAVPNPPAATAISPLVTRGAFPTVISPAVTNASSTNVELSWDVTNNGCAAANSVAVTFPAGWVWANDAYSLVNLNATTAIETWVTSGTNPVTFTSPNVASQLPLTFDGNFNLVFSATPASAGTSIFIVNVTDATGAVGSPPVSVTVNPYADADGLNNAAINSWREQFP